MRGPALILLHSNGCGPFDADHANLEAGVLTAKGKFRHVRHPGTYSWPMSQIKEVRWKVEQTQEDAA